MSGFPAHLSFHTSYECSPACSPALPAPPAPASARRRWTAGPAGRSRAARSSAPRRGRPAPPAPAPRWTRSSCERVRVQAGVPGRGARAAAGGTCCCSGMSSRAGSGSIQAALRPSRCAVPGVGCSTYVKGPMQGTVLRQPARHGMAWHGMACRPPTWCGTPAPAPPQRTRPPPSQRCRPTSTPGPTPGGRGVAKGRGVGRRPWRRGAGSRAGMAGA